LVNPDDGDGYPLNGVLTTFFSEFLETLMSISAECSFCHRKQAAKNKICKGCSENLDSQKKANKARYYIKYRVNGKQKTEFVGYSIDEAKAADGKRKGQIHENRIFDILPESKMIFKELTEWYMNLPSVKTKKSYDRIALALKNFNVEFGDMRINDIKQNDLENYQILRDKQGRSSATIDMEIKIAQTMITKAFDNDKIDGKPLKAFRRTKRKLKKGSNARKKTIAVEEYLRLIANAPSHLKTMLVIAFNTGMRAGEIRGLTWGKIDLEKGLIKLSKADTKEGKSKTIPINSFVNDLLKQIPLKTENSFIVTFKGLPISQKDGYKRSFKTCCKKAGLPCGRNEDDGITFHDIRRTVKTFMLEAGVDKAYRDAILGHSPQGMDAHYIAPSDENLKQAMAKYESWLRTKFESQNLIH
jgi:integrase